MMKKLFSFSVIAISAMMCASMLTSCGDDDNSATSNVPAQTGDRAIFQQHFKKNMKGIAENLSFTSWEVANNLNIDFNVNVLGNPAFGATLHQILTEQITANAAPASAAVQEKGYAIQSLVDLSQLHYRFTLKEDKSGFDVTPAECFELVHKADDGATNKLSIDFSGENSKMLAQILSQRTNVGVIMLIPSKLTFSISTTGLTGAETVVFKGELNNDIKAAGELLDITKDDWNVQGTLSSNIPAAANNKGDQSQVDFEFAKDPTTKKFVNKFMFVHNNQKVFEIDAANTHQGNLMSFLQTLPIMIAQGQLVDILTNPSLLNMLLSTVVGNSIDQLKLTLYDDLSINAKISDVGKAIAIQKQAKAARRQYASEAEIAPFAQQMNEVLSASLECKGVNQKIPVTIKTAPFGVDYLMMPALKFADEQDYVLLTDLLEKESLIYTLNIIDHGTPNATQGIVAISQVLAVMRTLLAGSTAQQ